MALSYTLSREDAAENLGVTTRTIDRYVKRGKLSYKKKGNKVYLNKQEVSQMKTENNNSQSYTPDSEVVQEITESRNDMTMLQGNTSSIDQKIDRFFTIFQEKEKIIYEKDKTIFILQQKIGELEARVQNMISLPDYSKEKQSILVEKQKLQDALETINKDLQKEKTTNTVYLGFLLIVVFLVLLLIYINVFQ